MGFFGTFLYDGSRWWSGTVAPAFNDLGRVVRGEQLPDLAEPWLLTDIHDSSFTIVTYRPAGPGTGTAYLGVTPRTYFADERTSAPTDVSREAAGLAGWWRQVRGGAGDAQREAKQAELAAYLAHDLDPDEIDLDEEEDVDELDDSEIFVEVKTGQFLAALDLPVPEELRR